jgi:hypothetical protein
VTLLDVVNPYDGHFELNLSEADKKDLVEYLKGIYRKHFATGKCSAQDNSGMDYRHFIALALVRLLDGATVSRVR